MPDPSVVYATDEDLKIRCSGDFEMLVPADQVVAGGTDGAISAASPWLLTSATVDFLASGVKAGSVVALTLPTSASPAHFGVVASSTGSVTLRRVGMFSGQGMPPAASDVANIAFRVPTFAPQIEDASYDLNRRYGINDDFADRQASYLYDRRELRQACVLTVLLRQYANESRTRDGDFATKIAVVRAELDDVFGRISVKFGQLGEGSEPVNRFSTRQRR